MGICIGGLAGDETPAQRRAALDVVVPLLADDPRPRYLMGLGSPADLLDAVDAGVDMFDSVLPARVARNGTVWIPDGRLNLRKLALPRRSGAHSRRIAGAAHAELSHGPTLPICCAPTSCSSTAWPLSTTLPTFLTTWPASARRSRKARLIGWWRHGRLRHDGCDK
jgi:hypothetical protein